MASRAAAAESTFQSVEHVLGGKGVLGVKPRSALDWIGMIREGIPAAAVESILNVVGLSQSELARALGIPERTLARRKREGVLNSEESSKLLRLRSHGPPFPEKERASTEGDGIPRDYPSSIRQQVSPLPCSRCWSRTSRSERVT